MLFPISLDPDRADDLGFQNLFNAHEEVARPPRRPLAEIRAARESYDMRTALVTHIDAKRADEEAELEKPCPELHTVAFKVLP